MGAEVGTHFAKFLISNFLKGLTYSALVHNRVSQKNQKSEFWFATNPTGFHRLDEPPEKISAL